MTAFVDSSDTYSKNLEFLLQGIFQGYNMAQRSRISVIISIYNMIWEASFEYKQCNTITHKVVHLVLSSYVDNAELVHVIK